MKSLTVQLPDEVYNRAEHKALEIGETLTGAVTELIRRYGESSEPASGNGQSVLPEALTRLLAALDAGRNEAPIGRLDRADLYDRPILH
jgi:hypothetical protein